MKTQLLFPISTLFLTVLIAQSCVVGGGLVDSKQVTVTHEHRVELPAAMYSPGASNTPMFEKQGEISLSVDMTNSGKNTNNDSNPNADPTHVSEGTTYQKISKTSTYSVNVGYALTSKIGLTGSLTVGKGKAEEYRPYIESWNLTEDTYDWEYWFGIPLTWDTWAGGSWYSSQNIQTVNDYQKVGKSLNRSYQYFDGELAIGKYKHHNKVKTGLYGGLGFAQNQYDGQLSRNGLASAYGHHEASFFKLFVLPSAAFRTGWLEMGTAIKGSFMNYQLKKSEAANYNYDTYSQNLFFVEPSIFLRFGPRAFRVNVEQKWLRCLGKAPFPMNRAFTSVGIMSILNVKSLHGGKK